MLHIYLFKDNVNIAGNQLGNLFSFSGLDRVVAILIVPKILQQDEWIYQL